MISEITPAILVRLLRQYSYEVTQRCLTDWRYKGHLPPLTRISRGFRNGVLRCWTQTDILKVALAVCSRLKRQRKRTVGAIHKNWLSGAAIPVSRARKSWLKSTPGKSHVPKQALQQCATKFGAEISMSSGAVRDVLDELQRVILRPKYRAGKLLDICYVQRFLQRVCSRHLGPAVAAKITEEAVAELLGYVNAYFSPAAARMLIASATDAELLDARNKWLRFWKGADALWQGLFVKKGQESSLMPLAGLLAPIGVVLLLPTQIEKPIIRAV